MVSMLKPIFKIFQHNSIEYQWGGVGWNKQIVNNVSCFKIQWASSLPWVHQSSYQC